MQQVHENCAHSRIKVLNSVRDFASLKWFGRLFPESLESPGNRETTENSTKVNKYLTKLKKH